MICQITSVDQEVITSSMSVVCIECVRRNSINGYGHISCSSNGQKKRIAILSNKYGTLLACCGESKTTKNFNDKVQSICSSIKDLIALREQVVSDTVAFQQARIDRLIHNLKSINAHYIQELYGLIPQERFTKNIWDTISIVEEEINKAPSEAAKTFLRLAKLTISTKAEFSIYEKLMKDNPPLAIGQYTIRDIVMIVLYMFFGDFSQNGVYVNVANSYEKARFDFESMQVAFYHIVENAAKYIRPNTNLIINFKKDLQYHYIEFEMESLHVLAHERGAIYNEGYSGINARELKKSGHGIGMYLIIKLLKLNNSVFISEFGNDVEDVDGAEYALNKFIVKIPI